jgi:phage/plasmid-associated DNA primase
MHARVFYEEALEFKCQANIFVAFNEVPSVDDISGGLERRLDLVDHNRMYVHAP